MTVQYHAAIDHQLALFLHARNKGVNLGNFQMSDGTLEIKHYYPRKQQNSSGTNPLQQSERIAKHQNIDGKRRQWV